MIPTRQPSVALSILVVSALFAVPLVSLTPSFQTNDDPGMSLIASGKLFCPAPNEHLIFSHYWIGHILKRLYAGQPDLPWYAMYLLGSQFVAHVVMLHALRAHSSHEDWRKLVVYGTVFLQIGVYFLNNLQFTTTAFLVTQSGIFLYIATAQTQRERPRRTYAAYGLTVFLVTWGAMIRWESFFFAVALSSPLFLWLCLQAFRGGISKTALLLPVVAGLSAIAVLQLDQNHYYADPQWREYFEQKKEKRKAARQAGGLQFTTETAKAFDAVNWTKNDLAMHQRWFAADIEQFSAADFRAIRERYPTSAVRKLDVRWTDWWQRFVADRLVRQLLWLLPLAALCVFREPTRLLLTLFSVAVSATVLLLLIRYVKAPSRIYFPLLAFPFCVATILPLEITRGGESTNNSRGLEHRAWSVVLLLSVAGIFSNFLWQWERSQNALAMNRSFRSAVQQMNLDGRLYVAPGASLPLAALLPLERPWLPDEFRTISGGWPINTPLDYATRQQFDIEDVYRALYERDNVLYLGPQTTLPFYQRYVQEHFDVRVTALPEFECDFFSTFRIRTTPDEP